MKATDRYLIEGVSCLMGGRALRVANLSVGGLFLATEDLPMLGQTVSLELSLAGRAPFPLLAQVTWLNQPDSPRAPSLPKGFGVKITRIAFPDKLAILDLLKRSEGHSRQIRGDLA